MPARTPRPIASARPASPDGLGALGRLELAPAAPGRRSKARDRILVAAEGLFYRRGFQGVGVDAIAAAASVTKMTLYKHFGSKEGLITAVLEGRAAEYLGRFREFVEQRASDPRMRLIAAFEFSDSHCRAPEFRGCPFSNAAAELSDPAHPGREVARRFKGDLQAVLRGYAEAAGLRNPSELAQALSLLIDGANIQTSLTGSPEPMLAARHAAAALIRASNPRGAPSPA